MPKRNNCYSVKLKLRHKLTKHQKSLHEPEKWERRTEQAGHARPHKMACVDLKRF